MVRGPEVNVLHLFILVCIPVLRSCEMVSMQFLMQSGCERYDVTQFRKSFHFCGLKGAPGKLASNSCGPVDGYERIGHIDGAKQTVDACRTWAHFSRYLLVFSGRTNMQGIIGEPEASRYSEQLFVLKKIAFHRTITLHTQHYRCHNIGTCHGMIDTYVSFIFQNANKMALGLLLLFQYHSNYIHEMYSKRVGIQKYRYWMKPFWLVAGRRRFLNIKYPNLAWLHWWQI